jgi:hypothetical protein
LQQVVNRAITASRHNRVAPLSNCLLHLPGGACGRMRWGVLHFDTGGAENGHHRFYVSQTVFAAASGIRIVEESNFAHGN